MKYVVMTATGVQVSGSCVALYPTEQEAREHMDEGDTLIPVNPKAKVILFPGTTRENKNSTPAH